jgi:hypothetical protein
MYSNTKSLLQINSAVIHSMVNFHVLLVLVHVEHERSIVIQNKPRQLLVTTH